MMDKLKNIRDTVCRIIEAEQFKEKLEEAFKNNKCHISLYEHDQAQKIILGCKCPYKDMREKELMIIIEKAVIEYMESKIFLENKLLKSITDEKINEGKL